MTKRKPDKVIEYRVSLQDKQSEQLDDILTVAMIGNILPSVVDLMKDVSAMVLILTAIAGLIGFTFIVSDDLSASQVIDAFLTQRQQAIAAGTLMVSVPSGAGRLLAHLLGLFPEQEP